MPWRGSPKTTRRPPSNSGSTWSAISACTASSGKTTLAVHVAAEFKASGGSAAVVDLDPQASASLWGDRQGRSPFVGAVPAARLEAAIDVAHRAGAGLADIDTPPTRNGQCSQRLRADLVVHVAT